MTPEKWEPVFGQGSCARRGLLVGLLRCDNRAGRRYFLEARTGGPTMPAIDDDDRPKKKITHEIGQDLTLLSVGELAERVALLKE